MKTTRTETTTPGSASFLSEARAALAEIRKIHAVDKNAKSHEGDDGGETRVAGKTRESAIQERIDRLKVSLKESVAVPAIVEQAG